MSEVCGREWTGFRASRRSTSTGGSGPAEEPAESSSTPASFCFWSVSASARSLSSATLQIYFIFLTGKYLTTVHSPFSRLHIEVKEFISVGVILILDIVEVNKLVCVELPFRIHPSRAQKLNFLKILDLLLMAGGDGDVSGQFSSTTD